MCTIRFMVAKLLISDTGHDINAKSHMTMSTKIQRVISFRIVSLILSLKVK